MTHIPQLVTRRRYSATFACMQSGGVGTLVIDPFNNVNFALVEPEMLH